MSQELSLDNSPPVTGLAHLRRFIQIRPILMALIPIVAALLVSGLILLAIGVDPLHYYGIVVERGLLRPRGLQSTLTRTAPLLLLGSSLIVAFRAGMWNLGTDGQFLLGALTASGLAPMLSGVLPPWALIAACLAAGLVIGGAWAILPALLRAYQGINDVVTTLMMSFLATSFCSMAIKLFLQSPDSHDPQTTVIAMSDRLPRLFGTSVHIGVLLGLVVVLGTHLIITRTAIGLKMRILGLNMRAARHAGLGVTAMTVGVFAASGGLAGFAGATDILGSMGSMRADWVPGYGLAVVPLIFLARMNGWAVILFVFAFSVLSIGSESAAISTGIPQYFNLVLVALILIFLALLETFDARRREKRE